MSGRRVVVTGMAMAGGAGRTVMVGVPAGVVCVETADVNVWPVRVAFASCQNVMVRVRAGNLENGK